MNRLVPKAISPYAPGVLFLLTLLIVGTGSGYAAKAGSEYSPEDCIQCHQTGSEESGLTISVSDYEASVHGLEVTCLDCHTGIVDDEHQTEEGSGVVDCSECHEQENLHGNAASEEDRPQCFHCHSRHRMRSAMDPASTVHSDQFPKTCGGCHAVESGKTDYFSWFPSFQIASHKKGDFSTAYTRDNCIGCHQGAAVHGETEAIDDQQCHTCHRSEDEKNAMWGRIHPRADRKDQPAIFAAASIYQVSIVIGVIMLLGSFFRSQARAHSRNNEAKKSEE